MKMRLEKFTRDDFDSLISWITDEKFLVQWCGKTFRYPLTRSQLEEYIKPSEQENPTRQIYKAVNENGEHIGNVSLERIDSENKTASIACVIVKESAQGKGAGEFMINEVINLAKEKFGITKLSLNVFDFNLPAIRCYKKCGFEITEQAKVKYDIGEFVNLKLALVISDRI